MQMICLIAMHLSKQSLRSSLKAAGLNKKLTILLIGMILLVGFLIRIAPALHHQTYFWFDQGLDSILAKQFVVDHRLNLVGRYSGLAGVLMGPLWTWMLAVPFVISGGSPVGNVVFFSLVATISYLAVYKFLLSVSRTAALFALIGVVFSPILVAYSNLIASPNPLSFLFIFYLWFLFRIVVDRKTTYWLPLLFLTGLFFQLEIGFALFTIPAILAAILVFKQWRLFLNKNFIFGLLFLGITFLPQVFFDLRHNFLISRGVLALFSGGGSLYGVHDSLGVRFVERAKSFRDDFVLMALYVQPTILAVSILLLSVFGWFLAFKNKLVGQINILKLLVTVIAMFYIGFSLYPGPLWTWYRAGLPVVYIMLLMIGLSALWGMARPVKPILIVILGVFIIQGINIPAFSERLVGAPIADNAILQNQENAIDFVYQKAAGKPFSYFAYTPPVYDYIWQYNFWWFGQEKYGYLPTNWQMTVPLLGIGKQNLPPKPDEGLFFLILEPNYERPWEPEGWKKTYIMVGQVISHKIFPGQIEVEERITNK